MEIHRIEIHSFVVLAVCLGHIVLLKDEVEPLVWSKVLSFLDQVFIKDMFVCCRVQLSFYPNQSAGPTEKLSHSTMLPPHNHKILWGRYYAGDEWCLVFSRHVT